MTHEFPSQETVRIVIDPSGKRYRATDASDFFEAKEVICPDTAAVPDAKFHA